MSAWSVLLRLLLGLVLVFNGSGGAMAAVHVHAVADHGAAGVMAAAEQAGASHAGCHGDPAGTVHHAPGKDAGGMAHGGKPPSPACCTTGGCECASPSAQASLAVVAGPVVGTARPPAHRATPDHRAPALPHLIRPPIG